MGLLLAADAVTLYPPGTPDERGWTGPGTAQAWSGTGNLQLAPGASDPRAAEGGGTGPFGPARLNIGELYLPPDAAPADGMTADVRGSRWVLSLVRLMPDPAGTGLDCFQATVTRDDSTDYGDG
jgi:hypothetical protein